VWINQTQLQWRPTPNTILIRYKKSSTPAFVVPEPVNLEYGIIEGHGDLLYFGSGKDGYLIHEDLEYNEYYSYTLWNIETRLDEDSQEKIVYNRYTGDGYAEHYPITSTVHATVHLESPIIEGCPNWNWDLWEWTYSENNYMPWLEYGYSEEHYPPIEEEGLVVGFIEVTSNATPNYISVWARATRQYSGTFSSVSAWIGCFRTTKAEAGGVRIYVNGNLVWARTESQFAGSTGQTGWLYAEATFASVSNPTVVIERYHTMAFLGSDFRAYMTCFKLE
jgi:hypothetical protein